jgi:hypothetical protein
LRSINEKYNAMLTEMGMWKQMVKDYPNMSVAQVSARAAVDPPPVAHGATPMQLCPSTPSSPQTDSDAVKPWRWLREMLHDDVEEIGLVVV